jgi:SAM-dependent methyltransferase
MHLLSLPSVYDLFQTAIGGNRFRRWFLTSFVESSDSTRVLDVGCGTGVAADFLRFDSYTGVDLSDIYIAKARGKSIPRATFLHGDCIRELKRLPSDSIDVAVCGGLFHHLSNAQSAELVSELARVIEAGGTMYAFEPILEQSTAALTRWLMRMDRGKNLHSLQEWRGLFATGFDDVELVTQKGRVLIPYDLVLVCAKSAKRL